MNLNDYLLLRMQIWLHVGEAAVGPPFCNFGLSPKFFHFEAT